jgi:hypothetical protein
VLAAIQVGMTNKDFVFVSFDFADPAQATAVENSADHCIRNCRD